MRTVYANKLWLGDNEVVRGLVVVDKTIQEDFSILFDEKTQQLLLYAMNQPQTLSEGGCHTFTRFCQFVVYFSYDKTLVNLSGGATEIGISIELLYFGTSDNVNDIFDYMLKLRNAGWEEKSRERIIEIARQIKADKYESHSEIAELKIKDPLDEITSFLL